MWTPRTRLPPQMYARALPLFLLLYPPHRQLDGAFLQPLGRISAKPQTWAGRGSLCCQGCAPRARAPGFYAQVLCHRARFRFHAHLRCPACGPGASLPAVEPQVRHSRRQVPRKPSRVLTGLCRLPHLRGRCYPPLPCLLPPRSLPLPRPHPFQQAHSRLLWPRFFGNSRLFVICLGLLWSSFQGVSPPTFAPPRLRTRTNRR